MLEEKHSEKTKHRRTICPLGIESLEPCTIDCEWNSGDKCVVWEILDMLAGIRVKLELTRGDSK